MCKSPDKSSQWFVEIVLVQHYFLRMALAPLDGEFFSC